MCYDELVAEKNNKQIKQYSGQVQSTREVALKIDFSNALIILPII
jgi:hypothetical protein